LAPVQRARAAARNFVDAAPAKLLAPRLLLGLESLVHERPPRNDVRVARLGGAGPMLFLGADFDAAERPDADAAAGMARGIADVRDALAARGVPLLVLLVPNKLDVYGSLVDGLDPPAPRPPRAQVD